MGLAMVKLKQAFDMNADFFNESTNNLTSCSSFSRREEK